jgi:hypothetical protein
VHHDDSEVISYELQVSKKMMPTKGHHRLSDGPIVISSFASVHHYVVGLFDKNLALLARGRVLVLELTAK